MNKFNKLPKNKLSEGQAIAVAVLLFVVGAVAAIYGLSFIIDYFFPNLLN